MLPFSRPSAAAAAFSEQQLKQLRAQCLVFLAFRNNMEPKKKHLGLALGECPAEGSSSSSGGGGDRRGADAGDSRGGTGSSSSSSPVLFSAATADGLPLPPPDLQDLSSLRLSSPLGGGTRRVIRRGPRKIE